MHCIMAKVLQTTVDTHCHKLATVVGQTKLTTLATIDVSWRQKETNQLSSDFKTDGSTLITKDTRISLQVTTQHRISQTVSVLKTAQYIQPFRQNSGL